VRVMKLPIRINKSETTLHSLIAESEFGGPIPSIKSTSTCRGAASNCVFDSETDSDINGAYLI
jgi:hypothetical protein